MSFCKYCKKNDHLIDNCKEIVCKICGEHHPFWHCSQRKSSIDRKNFQTNNFSNSNTNSNSNSNSNKNLKTNKNVDKKNDEIFTNKADEKSKQNNESYRDKLNSNNKDKQEMPNKEVIKNINSSQNIKNQEKTLPKINFIEKIDHYAKYKNDKWSLHI
jgi:FtsZ-interacting cell division protein ZipA